MWKKFKKNLSLPESYISMGLGLLVVIVAGMLIFNFIRSNRGKSISSSKQMEVSKQNVTENVKPQSVVSLPTTHKVETGESLWTIAEKYYHSGYNWITIASDNKLTDPNTIWVGQELKLPVAETIVPATSKVALEPQEKIEAEKYTVSRGDNLWQIAVRAYGDGYAWVKIAKANNLANPSLIHSGNILTIPR